MSECEKCPILTAPRKFGKNREIECINCPVRKCWEDLVIHGSNRAKKKAFLKEINATIDELGEIREHLAKQIETAKKGGDA